MRERVLPLYYRAAYEASSTRDALTAIAAVMEADGYAIEMLSLGWIGEDRGRVLSIWTRGENPILHAPLDVPFWSSPELEALIRTVKQGRPITFEVDAIGNSLLRDLCLQMGWASCAILPLADEGTVDIVFSCASREPASFPKHGSPYLGAIAGLVEPRIRKLALDERLLP